MVLKTKHIDSPMRFLFRLGMVHDYLINASLQKSSARALKEDVACKNGKHMRACWNFIRRQDSPHNRGRKNP
jgi:hypothetical protein